MRFKEIVLEVQINVDNPRVKTSFKKEPINKKYHQLPLKPTNKNINGLGVYLYYPEKADQPKLEVLLKNEKTGEFLGILALTAQSHGTGSFLFSDIDLDPSIQGGTTAIKLYAYVIKDLGYTVVSDNVQTLGAVGLWKRLSGYPGIVVYQWDLEKDKYSVWQPSEYDSAYVSTDDNDDLNREEQDVIDRLAALLAAGKIDKDEHDALLDKHTGYIYADADIMDKVSENYRLVATRQRGLGRG